MESIIENILFGLLIVDESNAKTLPST